MKKVSIEGFLVSALILGFSLWFWCFYTLPVSDFNLIRFFDHDVAYQVERILTYLNLGYVAVDSGSIDYGSELFYYSFLLRPFKGLLPMVAWYHFIQFFHFIALLGCFYFSWKMLEPGKRLLFFLAVLFSPLFIHSAFFIKPDANILLFFILGAFYFLNQEFKSKNCFNIFVFIGVAVAIKWWGWFLIGPLFLFLRDPEKRAWAKKQGFLFFGSVIFIVGVYLSYRYLNILLEFRGALLEAASKDNGSLEGAILNGLDSAVYFKEQHRFLLGFFLGIFWLLVSGTTVVIGKSLRSQNLFSAYYSFLTVLSGYLIFNLPYLRTSTGVNSMNFWRVYVGPSNPGLNLIDWLKEYAAMGIFTLPMIVAVVLVWMQVRRFKSTSRNFQMILVFLVAMVATLFLLIKRNNYVSGGLIYFLLMYYLIGRSEWQPRVRAQWITGGLIASQMVWVYFLFPYYHITDFFLMPSRNVKVAHEINTKMHEILGEAEVITCQRSVPFLSRPYQAYNLDECRDPQFISALKSGTFIIDEHAGTHEKLKTMSQVKWIIEVSVLKYDRFGKEMVMRYQVWRRI